MAAKDSPQGFLQSLQDQLAEARVRESMKEEHGERQTVAMESLARSVAALVRQMDEFVSVFTLWAEAQGQGEVVEVAEGVAAGILDDQDERAADVAREVFLSEGLGFAYAGSADFSDSIQESGRPASIETELDYTARKELDEASAAHARIIQDLEDEEGVRIGRTDVGLALQRAAHRSHG